MNDAPAYGFCAACFIVSIVLYGIMLSGMRRTMLRYRSKGDQ